MQKSTIEDLWKFIIAYWGDEELNVNHGWTQMKNKKELGREEGGRLESYKEFCLEIYELKCYFKGIKCRELK